MLFDLESNPKFASHLELAAALSPSMMKNHQLNFDFEHKNDDGSISKYKVQKLEHEQKPHLEITQENNQEIKPIVIATLFNSLKSRLLEARPLFDLVNHFYPNDASFFPPSFYIKPDGELSENLATEIPPKISKLIHNKVFLFRQNLIKATNRAIQHNQELVDNSAFKPIKSLGQNNFADFLEKLESIKLIGPETKDELSAKVGADLAKNHKFFFDLTISLNQLKAKALYAFSRNQIFDRELFSAAGLKKAHENLAPVLYQLHNNEEPQPDRFRNDFALRLQVDQNTVYAARSKGIKRDKNEDELCFGVAKFDHQDPATIASGLQNMLLDVSEKLQQQTSIKSGSTALACCYLPQTKSLVIANCGDSRATLFMHNRQNGKVTSEILTSDHNFSDVVETARVLADDGRIKDGRVFTESRNLNLSRSIGDVRIRNSDGKFLISGEADIFVHNLANLPLDRDFFLMLSSDGLYNSSANRVNNELYSENLTRWFVDEELRLNWNNNPAEYLRDVAMLYKSVDNISTIFTKLEFGPEATKPLIFVDADGHGGVTVAKGLVENIFQLLDPSQPRFSSSTLLSNSLSPQSVSALDIPSNQRT